MHTATLYRLSSSDEGTLGVLVSESGGGAPLVLATMEAPTRDNVPNYSCIPEGTYRVVWEHSAAFKRYLYELYDVPGRTETKFHPGNYGGDYRLGFRRDTRGCILPGTGFVRMRVPRVGNWQDAVEGSHAAVSLMEAHFGTEPWLLSVVRGMPPPGVADRILIQAEVIGRDLDVGTTA